MKKIIYILFVCLSVIVFSSCKIKQSCLFSKQIVVDVNGNSIRCNEHSMLKITPSVLSLKEKKLYIEGRGLSSDMKTYISMILRESSSDQDSLIMASYDFILVKKAKKNQRIDANCMYHYDFENSSWVCSYVNSQTGDVPFVGEPCTFFRKVYVINRRNRMIIKDNFEDFSVIYIIQGKDNKTDFCTTAVWNPSDFSSLITTTGYIRERIDPISYDIAKNKYFEKAKR